MLITLTCIIVFSFSRLVDTGDSAEDKPLNGSYTLLYAAVDDVSGTIFSLH